MKKLYFSVLVGIILLAVTGNVAAAKSFDQIEQDNDTIGGRVPGAVRAGVAEPPPSRPAATDRRLHEWDSSGTVRS